MNTVRCRLQHLLNPLHVYCRLHQAGLAKGLALRLAEAYERLVYRHILC